MTREEAIKILNTVLFFGKCDCPKEEIEECLKMAIKALEQDPTNLSSGTRKNSEKLEKPTAMNVLALLEKTYADFCNSEGGEGWLKIDGKEYPTDAGYAIEGVDIFMEVFKRRLAESEENG